MSDFGGCAQSVSSVDGGGGASSRDALQVPRRGSAASGASGGSRRNSTSYPPHLDGENAFEEVELAPLEWPLNARGGGGGRDSRTRPVGTAVERHGLNPPRPTSVWSETVLNLSERKGESDRISNQLEIHGNMADATTQVDPRILIAELPSERRLKKDEGYALRMQLETSMPYAPGIVRGGPARAGAARQKRHPSPPHPRLTMRRTAPRV